MTINNKKEDLRPTIISFVIIILENFLYDLGSTPAMLSKSLFIFDISVTSLKKT
jgi:hypothetical protein